MCSPRDHIALHVLVVTRTRLRHTLQTRTRHTLQTRTRIGSISNKNENLYVYTSNGDNTFKVRLLALIRGDEHKRHHLRVSVVCIYACMHGSGYRCDTHLHFVLHAAASDQSRVCRNFASYHFKMMRRGNVVCQPFACSQEMTLPLKSSSPKAHSGRLPVLLTSSSMCCTICSLGRTGQRATRRLTASAFKT